tara:strand:- start:48 stop:872 length:825 start_codon:yes stop_codon:yes gene_type:complete
MNGLIQMKNKIIDCITFFDENFIFDLRYNIIKQYVDFIIICESEYDHRGNKKDLNFNYEKYSKDNKVKYFILKEPFPKKNNPWENQAIQREFLLNSLNFINDDDYIFFSDPDEIPNTDLYNDFRLEKKYGIFLQKSFNYKFNLFNKHESPWDGTRVCKKKNLKSIDYMRQKVWAKNLKYKFYRFDKEKNIQLFQNGGWHFNNIMSPENISKKLKTFAHSEYSGDEFSSTEIIKNKIENRIDLFNRGYKFEKIELDNTFPRYLLENKNFYKDFIV